MEDTAKEEEYGGREMEGRKEGVRDFRWDGCQVKEFRCTEEEDQILIP